MRGIGVLAMVGLALAGLASEAEARGRRFGIGFGVGASYAATPRAQSVRQAGPSAAPALLRDASPSPLPAIPVSAPAPAKAAESTGSWCAAQRVVGSGKGFCLVN